MVSSKLRFLAAGVSVLALGTVASAQAAAANIEGIRQDDFGLIAINLYEVGEAEAPAESGAVEAAANPAGHALAEAIVSCALNTTCPEPGAIAQYALGTQSAANGILIDGSIGVGARAEAAGASATAAGVVRIGVWQVAAAAQSAQNEIEIGGLLGIDAAADALAATGSAVAFAGIGAGVSQIASSIGVDGVAANSIDNSGELIISANAVAEAALADAAATALIDVGIYQEANGQEFAGADIANSGTIAVEAGASAVAENGIAFATASAAGIVQVAGARTQQFASTLTSGGLLIGTSSDTPSGPASIALTNSGSIEVGVHAIALGGVDVAATGAVLGVAQLASGSSAEAVIDNSGSIAIAASVDSEGSGTPRGVVFVSGVSQAATAYAFSTVETIDQNDMLTYQLSSTPVGPAVASLANGGAITVAGEVDVVALGTTSMAEGLGVAFVDGFDQYANGDGASVNVDNSGSFTVSASVSIDSGNLSNAVAIATGIDQSATAYAGHATAIFANGTTTPTTITGGATAIGSASATLDNSGAITVVANVDSHGDAVAFAGATASAIGQFAAGTEAAVTIVNSGTITSVGSLSSSGRTAFGGVGAIGMQQGAQGTAAADVLFDNGGSLAVLASAAAEGEIGAFVNATAFGVAQNVQADGSATASILNSGTIDIRAVASAVAADASTRNTAMAFAVAHGLGQLAEGQLAAVEYENSGTFQMLAEVDAVADDFAVASATASGAIQQIALGTASGTAAASIDNSGTILVGAFADVAAGSTAAALAAVSSAIGQAVVAGAGGSASITNSGTILIVANAEALAAGGDVTDIGSAQAHVFGINGAVSATGAVGVAAIDLANAGTIDISAAAHATGSGLAQARASVASGLVGVANVAFDGSAEVNLTNEGTITLVGAADATGGFTANATGIAVAGMDAFAAGAGVGDATAAITNSGSVMLDADAHAEAGTNALAVAIAIDGLQATAHAGIGDALAEVTNSGELEMIANATASALNAQAFAIVGGTFFTGAIFQSAAAMSGNASVIADNSGSISVVADALANGGVIASASAVGGPGVNQFAFATSGDAFAGFTNSRSIDFGAHAEAKATNSAYADAVFYHAIGQFANANGGAGEAVLQLSNEGSISLAVIAEASGEAGVGALAIATDQIGQFALAIGNDATLDLDNSGSIEVNVAAIAHGSNASAEAVLASALQQTATAIGDGGVVVALDNSGSIDLALLASAEATDGAATALAVLDGALTQYGGAGSSQYVYGTTEGGLTSITQSIFPTGPASLLIENSGSIDVAVAAVAEGGSFASAVATGLAVSQLVRGTDASAAIANDGSISLELGAMAEAEHTAIAEASLTAFIQAAAAVETNVQITATAGGGQVTASSTNPVGAAHVSFANSGTIDIAGIASAEAATGSAVASMFVQGLSQSVRGLDAEAAFANEGEYSVGARAEAVAGTAANATATAIGYVASGGGFGLDFSNAGEFSVLAEASVDGTTGEAVAHAIGVSASADDLLTGSITNSGIFVVSAEVSSGTAAAVGIRVTGTGVALDPAAVLTIVNDGGTIIVRQSSDGGDNWLRGMAIDVSEAPNAAVINLLGDGSIYGNIDLAEGDAINVAGGETSFDGIINPECLAGGCGQGTLNIASGGALFLRHDSAGADGPSAAFVEQLNIAAVGTLIFELPTGADPEDAYPQIFADVANLDGTLLVRSAGQSGLFADEYFFDNVIDANVRNGQFDACGIDGDPVLLELSCAYDSGGNVDLSLERVAFNAVAWLGRNQAAVGSGIEALYDPDLTGPFANLVAQLFTFDDEQYRDALTELTGASYGAYLQSFSSLGVHYNDLLDKATECEFVGRAGSGPACRTEKFRLWGQLDIGGGRDDGDAEAPGYDSERWTALIGADLSVGEQTVLGASFAKVSHRTDFPGAAMGRADGYQVGAYTTFDPGNFYAKAVGTLSWFDGDGRRRIDWTPLGGTLTGELRGDPDVRLWTLGARLGYRIDVGGNSELTPFLNLDHGNVRLDGFTETGLAGANLTIRDSTTQRTTVTAGAKWAMDLGNVVPQAELGYRHSFGDRRASFEASFLGDQDGLFEIVSAAQKRGSLMAGLSLGGRAGPVDLRVGYQGSFNGDAASHNGNLRIILPIGSR